MGDRRRGSGGNAMMMQMRWRDDRVWNDHLKLNVNISMTVGRIFTKNINLYIFILGVFSKTGKTRVSHPVKMMTR